MNHYFHHSLALTLASLGLFACNSLGNDFTDKMKADADQGNAEAQSNLGKAYFTGNGVPQDDEEAVKWLRKAADQGNTAAQKYLGKAYAEGKGVQKNAAEAVKWFRKAADQGDAEAQKYLGYAYGAGDGVPQDEIRAYMYYNLASVTNPLGMFSRDNLAKQITNEQIAEGQRLSSAWKPKVPNQSDVAKGSINDDSIRRLKSAADQGDANAQNNLGLMYFEGKGVQKDDAEAVKWWLLAADQGDAAAQYNLGYVYAYGGNTRQIKGQLGQDDYGYADNGKGVPQDNAEAVKWYRKAADQGHVQAQYKLGMMYENSRSVLNDVVLAYLYYNLAAVTNSDAAEKRRWLAKEMTPEQIAKAQKLSREWKPSGPKNSQKEPAWERPGTKEAVTLEQVNTELNRVYNQLMSSLDPQQQKTLKEEERAWIKWRDEEVTRLVGPPRGGSGYRVDYLDAMVDLVQKRLEILKNYEAK